MQYLATSNKTSQELAPQAAIGADLYARFIAFIDAAPKTVETYSRALKQLFSYFSLTGITRPQREDIIAFKEDLKASGHKPTTVQSYITAAKLFFKWTEQQGLYPNIAEHLKGAKLSREHKKDYLTSRQMKDILSTRLCYLVAYGNLRLAYNRSSPRGCRRP